MFIIQSLQSDEMQTGTLLERRLNEWTQAQRKNFQVVTYEVHSIHEWHFAYLVQMIMFHDFQLFAEDIAGRDWSEVGGVDDLLHAQQIHHKQI